MLELTRGFSAFDRALTNQLKQWFGTIRQPGAFRGPVVHFGVDIDGIVASPWRKKLVAPNAGEIGRLRLRTRTGDQQVAAEVVEQRRQFRRDYA